jgi:hypothetical protein
MSKITGFSSSASFDGIAADVLEPTTDAHGGEGFTPNAAAFTDGVELSSLSRWGGVLDGFFDTTWGAGKKPIKEGGSTTVSCPKGTEPVVTTDKDGSVNVRCEKPANPTRPVPILD